MHCRGISIPASKIWRTDHFFLFKAHIKRGLGASLHSIRTPKSQNPSISHFPPSENNGYEYQWDRYDLVDRWKTHVGPATHELAQLQPGRLPRLDQCIGIIASAVYLDEETWKTHFARNSISPSDKKPRSNFTRFTQALSRISSMSSIKAENSGRHYLESLLGNQGDQHSHFLFRSLTFVSFKDLNMQTVMNCFA